MKRERVAKVLEDSVALKDRRGGKGGGGNEEGRNSPRKKTRATRLQNAFTSSVQPTMKFFKERTNVGRQLEWGGEKYKGDEIKCNKSVGHRARSNRFGFGMLRSQKSEYIYMNVEG